MTRSATRCTLAAVTLAAACARVRAPQPTPAPLPAADTATKPKPPASPVTRPAVTPSPVPPPPRVAPTLPPIPLVEGPLAIKVVYPATRQLIESRDSNFIFGSVGNGNATLTINGEPARVYPNGAFLGWLANPPASAPRYALVAALGGDTARASHEVRVRVPNGNRPDTAKTVVDTATGWVRIGELHPTVPDTDDVVVGRPTPGETYRWFLLPGTVVERTGRLGGFTRVRLDRALQVWLADSVVHAVDERQRPPKRVAGNGRVHSSGEWEDLDISVGERPTYLVEEHEHTIELTLYDTRANTDLITYATNDTLIRHVEWEQVTDDRVRYTVHLGAAPFGYLVLWERNRFVLRVRRPPAIDPDHPLRGRTIALDAGHPPAGSEGPTALLEPTATLAVAERAKAMLEARGARVVMTRTTADPVALSDRAVVARRADAQAFVSIHLNAYPDGVNLFTASVGSGTYFYRGQSEPLARTVQRGLVANMGLEDAGVFYRSFAVVRQTWMPAVLCEGAFVIIPEQEAALRTPEFQDAYARGVADGLEAYFRSLGTAR